MRSNTVESLDGQQAGDEWVRQSTSGTIAETPASGVRDLSILPVTPSPRRSPSPLMVAAAGAASARSRTSTAVLVVSDAGRENGEGGDPVPPMTDALSSAFVPSRSVDTQEAETIVGTPRFSAPQEAPWRKSRRLVRTELICRVHLRKKAERALKRMWSQWRAHCEKQCRFNELGEAEVWAITTAFNRCDQDRDGLLSLAELHECIAELGLSGTEEDRHQVIRLCLDLWPRRDAEESAPSAANGSDSDGDSGGEESDDGQDIGCITIFDVSLKLIPRLRHAFEEARKDALQRRLLSAQKGADANGMFALQDCARVAWSMGIDPRMFVRMAEPFCPVNQESSPQQADMRQYRSSSNVSIQAQRVALPHTGRGPAKPSSPQATCSRATAWSVGGGLDWKHSRTTTLDTAARVIVKCHERVLRALRQREREIQSQNELDLDVFASLQPQLVELYDRFRSYCSPEVETPILSHSSAWLLLKEMGFLPGKFAERQRYEAELWAAAEVNGAAFCFETFVGFLCKQRDSEKTRRAKELALYFKAFDKEKVGSLSLAEVSQALEHLKLTPRTREEQEVMRLLFLQADPAAMGRIRLPNFQALCMLVEEQARLCKFEAALQCGMELGYSETEVRELWRNFDEPREATEKSQSQSLRRSFSNLRHSSLQLDVGPRSSDPHEGGQHRATQVSFFAYIQNVKQEAPANTSYIPEDAALRARLLFSPWPMRRALTHMRLPKDYIQSLKDEELLVVLADYFGWALAGPMEDLPVVLAAKLGVHSWLELQRAAQALGRQMAEGHEQGRGDPRGSGSSHSASLPLRA